MMILCFVASLCFNLPCFLPPVVNKSKMLSAGVADVVLKFLQSEMPPVQFKLLGTLRMLIDTQGRDFISPFIFAPNPWKSSQAVYRQHVIDFEAVLNSEVYLLKTGSISSWLSSKSLWKILQAQLATVMNLFPSALFTLWYDNQGILSSPDHKSLNSESERQI